MGHVVTTLLNATFTQIGGGQTEFRQNIDVGSGSNRAILVNFKRRSDRAIVFVSATIGGEALTLVGTELLLQSTTNWHSIGLARSDVTVTGFQDLVIVMTTNGSNASTSGIASVYDNVDPNAAEADLHTIEQQDLEQTPWTGTTTIDIPSATGEQAVIQLLEMSADVGWTTTIGGYTSRLHSQGGGFGQRAGDAAGAATVSTTFTYSALTQDLSSVGRGWSLPAPAAGGTPMAPMPMPRRIFMGA